MMDLDLTAAVEAVAREIYTSWNPAGGFNEHSPGVQHRYREAARPIVAAAVPIIAAQVAERIATEARMAEARAYATGDFELAYQADALFEAARIARETVR